MKCGLFHNLKLTSIAIGVSATFSAGLMVSPALADAGFKKWIRDFRGVATQNGVRTSTYDAVFAGITSPDPEVIKSANFQPEFKSKVWDYMDNRITKSAIEKGQALKIQYKPWLDKIEKRYGVDRNILMAIWSMETSYGAALERDSALRSVARSLGTLAYQDKRRRKFARSQLISAMKIVQNGDVSARGRAFSQQNFRFNASIKEYTVMPFLCRIPTLFQVFGLSASIFKSFEPLDTWPISF